MQCTFLQHLETILYRGWADSSECRRLVRLVAVVTFVRGRRFRILFAFCFGLFVLLLKLL